MSFKKLGKIKPCFPERAFFYWQAKPDDGRAGVLLPPPGSAAHESCGQPAPQAETADHSKFKSEFINPKKNNHNKVLKGHCHRIH